MPQTASYLPKAWWLKTSRFAARKKTLFGQRVDIFSLPSESFNFFEKEQGNLSFLYASFLFVSSISVFKLKVSLFVSNLMESLSK